MDSFLGSKEDILKTLNVDPKIGLNEESRKSSLEKYGANSFTKEKGATLFQKILESLKEPMILMLIFAGIIAISVNTVTYLNGGDADFLECLGIFIAISLSITITIFMEGKSAKSFEALNSINEDIRVKVIRDGNIEIINQKDLLVGDIAFIETGNKLPADGRLIESVSLNIDESALTGESEPVEKDSEAILTDEKTPVAERINMAYSGSFVTTGNGKMVVTSVGDTTEFGKIARELSKTQKTSTPLQEKLAQLGKRIAMFGITAAVIVFVIQVLNFIRTGNANFETISEAFITSIVLIVASVPEGLPTIVAVSLSINIIKMAKQNALVKKMVACETIGSVNVICSDKTGTLTENKMTLNKLFINCEYVEPENIKDNNIIKNFAINSTADVDYKDNQVQFLGNPTECALLVAAKKSGFNYKEIRERAEIIYEYLFSSDTKNMTTVVKIDNETIVFTKGSPEKIMSMCIIKDDDKKCIEEAIEKFQDEAKRVIAFAHKKVDNNVQNIREELESNMIYDGFAAISDPVRKEVYDAVDKCRSAGINIKMLTGDNIVTARAIARELKILDKNSIVLEAKDIDAMDDNTLKQNLNKISVIARSTPTVKMRVVNAIKDIGNVVAVTGDGINDAPAIKNADVGVAMGITGTEVSKEASDIVLLDDSFATIVKAIQWGRGIYDNFQRFIQFQLTVNLASVVVVLISTLTGVKSPFSAIQLLWINIIMDGPPAIALGLEPIRDNLMKRMPTKRNASIVTKRMIFKIVFSATVMIILFMLQSKLNILQVAEAQQATVLFVMFVMFQIFNSFNSRELGYDSVFKYFLNNKLMLLSMGATFILQILVTQFAGGFFNTVPLSFNTWLKIVGISFIVILAAEIFKIFVRLLSRK
ncbi:calcium-translocating P-type ATPase, PMCA-type [Brachyspira sp.]|uniref:calcium-translocating P-type ATPase, PMCA-type n=1 Tax=Brachyspira sp. TaxID=1977261 RepID=UPI00260D5DB5|nr:calcium-translocating P-type ATPase, PMCA-type [Brachyspira sp.]